MDPAVGSGIIVDPDAQLDVLRVRVSEFEQEEALRTPVPSLALGRRELDAGPLRGLKGDAQAGGGAGQRIDRRRARDKRLQIQRRPLLVCLCGPADR